MLNLIVITVKKIEAFDNQNMDLVGSLSTDFM